jgi:hypothetical protein
VIGKRKAPTTEDIFANTLAGLLDDDVTASAPTKGAQAPTDEPAAKKQKPAKTLKAGENPILALSSRPLPKSSTAEALERKAKRALKAEEKERQDRARVKNVIEGWGPTAEGAPGGQEWERGLRKVAQRGGTLTMMCPGFLMSNDPNSHQALQRYSASIRNTPDGRCYPCDRSQPGQAKEEGKGQRAWSWRKG